MKHLPETRLATFIEAARHVANLRLVRWTSGNLSWRLNPERILITASGARLDALSAADVALCRLSDGICLNGREPSAETGLHLGVLHRRPQVHVVLHVQSPCATVLACRMAFPESFDVIPEIPCYVGPVAWVPFALPGSVELAGAVADALSHHNLAVLANHGQVAVGATFDEAIRRAVFFELAAEIVLQAGTGMQTLSPEAVAHLRARAAQGEGA